MPLRDTHVVLATGARVVPRQCRNQAISQMTRYRGMQHSMEVSVAEMVQQDCTEGRAEGDQS